MIRHQSADQRKHLSKNTALLLRRISWARIAVAMARKAPLSTRYSVPTCDAKHDDVGEAMSDVRGASSF